MTVSYIVYVKVSLNAGENHRNAIKHWQTLTQWCIKYTFLWEGFELKTLVVIGIDCIGSCKPKYDTIMAITAPHLSCTIHNIHVKQ